MTIVGAEEWVLRITMGVLYGKMCKHGHARSVGRMSLTGWDIRRRRCGERVAVRSSTQCAGSAGPVVVSFSGGARTAAACEQGGQCPKIHAALSLCTHQRVLARCVCTFLEVKHNLRNVVYVRAEHALQARARRR